MAADREPTPASLIPPSSTEERFLLLASTRRVAWVAVAVAAVLLVSSPLSWVRWSSVAVLALLLGAELWLRGGRPVLVVSDTAYRVEARGVVRFDVPFSQVKKALHDASEQALYLDCGERKHNLLLPPRAGFSFTFSDRDRLYQRLLSALRTYSVPIEAVARLELPRPDQLPLAEAELPTPASSLPTQTGMPPAANAGPRQGSEPDAGPEDAGPDEKSPDQSRKAAQP